MTGSHPKRIYLIDGTGLLYRAYFAMLRRPLTTSRGEDVGAVFGFANTLLALLREQHAEHLAVAFDSAGPTFRHERYPDYKANRPEMPPELAAQIPIIRRLVEAMGLSGAAREGIEADDLIGSAAQDAVRSGWEVTIVSADKDFAQLIGPRIRQFVPPRGREPGQELDAAAVAEKWGVRPDQFIDYLALTGDSSDNIPGVKGIGPKTAARLLQAHMSLDQIFADLAKVEPAAVRRKLADGQAAAELSRELVAIRTDLPTAPPESCQVPDPAQRPALRELLAEMEFGTLIKRIFPPATAPAAQLSLESAAAQEAHAIAGDWAVHYRCVGSRSELREILAALPRGPEAPPLAIDTETAGLDARATDLVGLSFGWEPGRAWYVPLGHAGGPNLPLTDLCAEMREILRDETLVKAGQNLKFDLHVLQRHGLPVGGPLVDTMVASYLCDPSGRHGLDALVREHLQHPMLPITALIGEGKQQISFAQVPVEHATGYACEDADAVVRLVAVLTRRLKAIGAEDLMRQVEMPLLPILAGMEGAGILLDSRLLSAMGEMLAAELTRTEADIHRLAGRSFNVNSPKQLQEVLFTQLKLPARRRTKTGYSTSQEVLEELAGEHPLPGKLLTYRQLAKLRSTYVEALPRMVDAATGRVHAEFHQTVTATGRLSSSNPNLQNIPIRTALGREIRKAFVAPRGRRLLSADYSQIELRILAHLSGDEHLVAAFRGGADIHRATAARVFGVDEGQVDGAMRGRAKVVNFGVLYGMGAQRLAREQGISVAEASRFISEYFEKLPGVKRFIDSCIARARSRGYAETLLGRRRYLPDLQATRHQARAAAERMAVNTPVQGSAADLIKLAMVRVARRLEAEHAEVRLLLQVHDELVFEVPAKELAAVRRAVVEEMSTVMELRVPLVVSTGTGRNWYAAHA